jgi:hypothetical protein
VSDPAYHEAVALLRTVSKSAPDRPRRLGFFTRDRHEPSRATKDVPANPLRTRADRQRAAISAAEAIRAAGAGKAGK